MQRSKHAQQIANRFRELVEGAGDSLPSDHYDELSLLIEAGIDTAVMEKIQQIADKLEAMATSMRRDAEFFD